METVRVLVDTSILIDHFRKQYKDRTLFHHYALQYNCVISMVTEFEFKIGTTPKSHTYLESMLSTMNVLPFDSSCVESALTIQRHLKRINKLLPIQDLFIAATAITHNIRLLTLNSKHFVAIPHLSLLPLTE